MNTRVRLFIWIEFKIRVSANDEQVNQGIRILIVIIFPIICNLETYITYQYMCHSYMCISYSECLYFSWIENRKCKNRHADQYTFYARTVYNEEYCGPRCILDYGSHAVSVDDVTERDQYGSSNTPVFVYVFHRYCIFVSFHVDVHYWTCRIKHFISCCLQNEIMGVF